MNSQNQENNTSQQNTQSTLGPDPVIETKKIRPQKSVWNFGKIFFGSFLVVVGLFYLARGVGIIPNEFVINWPILWPLCLILIGLSFISARSITGKIIGVFFMLIVLSVILVIIFSGSVFGLLDNSKIVTQEINIQRETTATDAVITIKTGAGELAVKGGATGLVSGNLMSNFLFMDIASNLIGKTQNVVLYQKSDRTHFFNFLKKYENKLALSMSNSIPLNFETDIGASNIVFDFTDVMLKKLTANIGASKLSITLGNKLAESIVDIKSGASAISIIAPKTLGVVITLKSGLTSKRFSDFTQINDITYRSNNYLTTSKKIAINLELGASNVTFDWK